MTGLDAWSMAPASAVLANAMVSPWITIPLAAVGMVLIAGYTLAIQTDRVPQVRRRVRTALGVLYIFILAAFTYGVSIASPSDKKTFVLCWVLVVGLVAFSVVLALVDAAVTVKIALRDRQADARRTAAELAESILRARQQAREEGSGAGVAEARGSSTPPSSQGQDQ